MTGIDEENGFVEIARISNISYKELKKYMLMPNIYKFFAKYDLFLDDILPRLSEEHMLRMLEYWKAISSRMTIVSAKTNSSAIVPIWLTVENIVMAIDGLVHWREFMISMEDKLQVRTECYMSPSTTRTGINKNYESSNLLKNNYINSEANAIYQEPKERREDNILKIESELCECRVQEELNNHRKHKLIELEKKKSDLFEDLSRIDKEQSFIQTQINECERDETDLQREMSALENSNFKNRSWYSTIRKDLEDKISEFNDLREKCFKIKDEMEKKKQNIQENIEGEFKEEFGKGLEECKFIERELLERKSRLYEVLRELDN